MTAIKPVLKIEGSQKGCTLWGKVKRDFCHFSQCYLVISVVGGNKLQNGLIPLWEARCITVSISTFSFPAVLLSLTFHTYFSLLVKYSPETAKSRHHYPKIASLLFGLFSFKQCFPSPDSNLLWRVSHETKLHPTLKFDISDTLITTKARFDLI